MGQQRPLGAGHGADQAALGIATAPTTDAGFGGAGGGSIARSPGSVVVPCRARGMPMDHNFRVSRLLVAIIYIIYVL